MKKRYCISKFFPGPAQWVVALWEFDKETSRYVQLRYFKVQPTEELAEAWVSGACQDFMLTNPGDWWVHVGQDPNL